MKNVNKNIVLICPLCGREMDFCDTDYLYKDCYDDFFFCEDCNLLAIFEVRFGVPNMVFYRDLYNPEKNAKIHYLR